MTLVNSNFGDVSLSEGAELEVLGRSLERIAPVAQEVGGQARTMDDLEESLIRAVSATAGYDGRLSVAEAELIRAVCATLDYPLPPVLIHK